MYRLKNRNILIISPETWGPNLLSKHHYAQELSNLDNVVFFLTPGKSVAEHGKSNTAIQFLKSPKRIPGLRYLPQILQNKLMSQQVETIIHQTKCPIDIVWSFDNSWLFNFQIWGRKTLKIAHVADYFMDYNLETFFSSADLCLGISQAISSRMKTFNPKTFYVGHGCSVFPEIRQVANKRIRALYVGNLHRSFLNHRFLLQVVKQFPEIDFCFLSSYKKDNLSSDRARSTRDAIKELALFPNVQILPPRIGEAYSRTLLESDFCFLAYDSTLHPKETANPHKILEYLSAGKPIFTFPIADYCESDLLYQMENENEFLSLIQKFIDNPFQFSTPQLIEKRRKFAQQNSYKNKITTIETLINKHV